MNARITTPWGKAERVQALGRGILFVSTASHGGYFVPAELNRFIPLSHRLATFRGLGMQGWYEEDCDWCLVALAFRGLFPREAIDAAQSTFAGWIAPKLAKGIGSQRQCEHCDRTWTIHAESTRYCPHCGHHASREIG